VALMRCMPAWRKFKAVAHTLPYDAAALGDTMGGAPLPAARWNEIALPVLAAVGGNSPAWIHHSGQALADVLPNAEHRVLDGQTHMVKPKALAPMLTEFFTRQ
jgi:pimeloyl-ACP methyl ester carboxylesterase